MNVPAKIIVFVSLCVVLSARAQGPLTPPGAPAPTMKTLDQVEARTPITNVPCTISHAGSYYLTGDMTSAGHGIVIEADNVTVDLNGFALRGQRGGSSVGISVQPGAPGRNFITVRNGCIRDFNWGIYLQNTSQGIFQDLTVASNATHGIFMRSYDVPCLGTRIERCSVSCNGDNGIFLTSYNGQPCNENSIQDCTITANGGDGIYVDGSGSGNQCLANRIERNVVGTNGGRGIYLYASSGLCHGNRVEHNVINGNSSEGIGTDGKLNRIEGNQATFNGIGLYVHGSDNYVADNTVFANVDNYDLGSGNQLNLLLGRIPETLDVPCSVKLAGSLTCLFTGTNGITVASDDVTIDLAGHALIGPGASSLSGIYQSSAYRNLTVKNGKVVNWQGGVTNCGIQANGQSALIQNVQAATNAYGIQVGFGAILENCLASENLGNGYLTGGRCVLKNCVARRNELGMQVGYGCQLIGCVSDLAFDGNGYITGENCSLTDCSAWANKYDGFSTYGGCSLINCIANSNGREGISAMSGSVIVNCVARYNISNGIHVADNCQVLNCFAKENGPSFWGDAAGIYVAAWDNRIEGNTSTGNDRGIEVNGSGNFISRNTCSGNTNNWDVASGNVCLVVQAATAGAISGNSGGTSPGSVDPNANYTY